MTAIDVRAQVLQHLAALVAFDTQNPPRQATGFAALFAQVAACLAPLGFRSNVRDLGDGCMWQLLERGDASRAAIVNVHVDTVPAASGYSHLPHQLVLRGEQAIGLGACDTKGALAAYLVAAAMSEPGGPAALLLTSDEEAGQSRCVRTFVSEHAMAGRTVIVAEPTGMKAVSAHRGIATCVATFSGVAGHGSLARAHDDSAVHEAVRFCSNALQYAERHDVRLNIGRIEGGVKANMIASEATLRFGVRPAPALHTDDVLAALRACAANPARATFVPGYTAPPLLMRADELVERLGVVASAPVDFFTEAALFAQAGATAVVVGPGDIAHAHTADETVPVADLVAAVEMYNRVLGWEAA